MSERFAKNTVTDADADKVDAYLENDTYSKWSELDAEARVALAREKKLETALWKYDHSLFVLFPMGTDVVEKVRNDLAWGLDLIVDGKFPDPAQFPPLFDIYPLAIDTASLQMDEAEAVPITGLISGAASLRSVGLTITMKQLRDDLLELEDLLREAEAEEIEAEIKGLLGYVITTVELMVPGLGLVAKGALTAGEIWMEHEDDAAVGTKGVKIGLEAVEEMHSAGETVKHIAGRGGKFFTVTGFYFDTKEILHAKKNVSKLKELLEKAHKEYDQIKDKLASALKVLKAFQDHLDAITRPIRRQIAEKQRERDAMITKYSYSLITPVKWRIIEDYSRFHTAKP